MTSIRFVMLVVAIARGWPQSPPPPPAPKLPVIQTLKPKLPFEWSKSQKKEFLNRVKTLKAGDNIQDVVKLLGPPYFVEQTGPKERNVVTGTAICYFMKKGEELSDMKGEQEVILSFDVEGRLESIDTNIRKLSLGNLEVKGGLRFGDLEPLEEPGK